MTSKIASPSTGPAGDASALAAHKPSASGALPGQAQDFLHMAPGPAVRSNQPGQVEPPTQANRPLQARRLRRGLSTQPPDEPAQEPAQDPVPEAALGFEGVASGESDPQAPQTQGPTVAGTL